MLKAKKSAQDILTEVCMKLNLSDLGKAKEYYPELLSDRNKDIIKNKNRFSKTFEITKNLLANVYLKKQKKS